MKLLDFEFLCYSAVNIKQNLTHTFETQECRNRKEIVEKYSSSFPLPIKYLRVASHQKKKMFILLDCAPISVTDNFNGVLMVKMMTATFVFP